jgi:DNA-binding MarR family transcriptional regulator
LDDPRQNFSLENALDQEKDPSITPDLMHFIAPLILEIVLHAHFTCREIENELSRVASKLTMTDVLVLTHLGASVSNTLASISQELSVPKTTLHYALRKMEERGWIERSSHGQRADQPTFSLTPKGKERLAQIVMTIFYPAKDSVTYDWIASSYEPLIALAMTLRLIARMRHGAEYPERVTLEANRIISLAKEYSEASGSASTLS